MILSKQTTPWARDRLTVGERDAIAKAEPSDAYVTLGRSTGGWTCRIASEGWVIGEAYGQSTPMAAFREAQDALFHEDDEWTNREGMPEFGGILG